MTTEFKLNTYVWIKSEGMKAKVKAILRSTPVQYKLEIITNYNKDTSERTTKLITVNASDITEYREKKHVKERNPLQVKVKYFADIEPIAKIGIGEWVDLRASEDITLKSFEFKLIPLGVGFKLPKGYELNIVPRSSTYKNFKILQTNSYAVGDNSFSGNDDQYHFPALAIEDTFIEKGSRICQFRINRVMEKVEFQTVEFLDEVSRGGFGTTGTK
ncbi:dUTP diphosphatase [Psychrobacillus phage Perkons]|nr:dUTP diphosphatase [Psychrobacillus phage Perkons]